MSIFLIYVYACPVIYVAFIFSEITQVLHDLKQKSYKTMQHDIKSLKRDAVHNLCISMSDEHM